MKLTLRQMQIFVAVVDTASTTAAGNAIGLSQSATSGAVNELEHLLGKRLFDRIGKQLLLNEYGRTLLPQARSMLALATQIEQSALPQHIKLGASTTIGNYVLPHLLREYLQRYPDTQCQIKIGNTQEIASAVAKREIDMGLIEGHIYNDQLQLTPWIEDELVIVGAPDHPLLRQQPHLTIEQLQQSRWLMREEGSGTREAVDQALLPYVHHFTNTLELGNSEAIKQACAAGIGFTCLSKYVVNDFIEQKQLITIQTPIPMIKRQFYYLHHRQKVMSDELLTLIQPSSSYTESRNCH